MFSKPGRHHVASGITSRVPSPLAVYVDLGRKSLDSIVPFGVYIEHMKSQTTYKIKRLCFLIFGVVLPLFGHQEILLPTRGLLMV